MRAGGEGGTERRDRRAPGQGRRRPGESRGATRRQSAAGRSAAIRRPRRAGAAGRGVRRARSGETSERMGGGDRPARPAGRAEPRFPRNPFVVSGRGDGRIAKPARLPPWPRQSKAARASMSKSDLLRKDSARRKPGKPLKIHRESFRKRRRAFAHRYRRAALHFAGAVAAGAPA